MTSRACRSFALIAALALAWVAAAAQITAAEWEPQADDATLAAAAFERAAPLPGWAELLAVPQAPPAPGTTGSLRVLETQLFAGAPSVALFNRVIHLRDERALADNGHLAIDFDPRYQRLNLHALHVLRQGRTIDLTPEAPVRFLQRERRLQMGMYGGTTTASILLPGLRVGDLLHIVLSIAGENPALGQRYSFSADWELTRPVAHRSTTLVAPVERRIAWRWIGGSAGPGPLPTEHVAGGLRRLRFDERNLAAVEVEPDLPADAQPLRWLQFSEFADWAEVAQWAVDLFAVDAPLPDEVGPTMAALRAIDDADLRVSRALQWVQTEIRYWSSALGEGSHRPRVPADVVKLRYGDCKDKSLLLVRMLAELGIDATPVLASMRTRRGPARLLPTPEAFDHVVVRVRLDGRDHYLDTTRRGQVGRLAHMGQALEGAVVLPVEAGTRTLVTVRSPNSAELFRTELVERFGLDALDAEGSLASAIRWRGLAAETLRRFLATADTHQLEAFVLSGYEDRYPGIRLVTVPEVSDDRERNRVEIRARFAVPNLAREHGGHWAVRFVPQLDGVFALPDPRTRRLPVNVPAYPTTRAYEVEMTWPAGVAGALEPSAHTIDTPHFHFETTRSFRGNVDRRTITLSTKVPQVPPLELPRLLRDLFDVAMHMGDYFVVTEDEIGAAAAQAPPAAREPAR